MAAFKVPAVPKVSDPKIHVLNGMHTPDARKNRQAVEHRKGLLARALRGNKSAAPQQPTPQDYN